MPVELVELLEVAVVEEQEELARMQIFQLAVSDYRRSVNIS
jgi:hypothetical protein